MMALLKFDDFIFDPARFKLTHKGKQVALRPKASILLHLLITNRDRVVSKDEIFSTVWGSSYARDHLLFQLISELRKSPLQSDFVRTLPNQGYQWNALTLSVSEKRSTSIQIAASFVVVLAIVLSTTYFKASNNPIKSAQLPAHSALTKGIVALNNGKNEQAIEWLQFSVNENPASIESSLFLAEALFQHDRVEESLNLLQDLTKVNALDPYSKMIADDLHSRIYLRQGRLRDAMRFARKSNRADIVAQCSVNAIEQRLVRLSNKLGVPKTFVAPNHQQENIGELVVKSKPDNYDDQCRQLNKSLGETSLCLPGVNRDFYVIVPQMSFLLPS